MRKKLSGFLGFSGSPGSRTFFENPRDRDPEHLCKNPRDFYIPGIGIFFRGMGNPDKKPPLPPIASYKLRLIRLINGYAAYHMHIKNHIKIEITWDQVA